MKTLTFPGYSDDTFACDGSGIDVDYDNCKIIGPPIEMRVRGAGGEMIVTGHYCAGSATGWAISVAQALAFLAALLEVLIAEDTTNA